LSGELAAIWLNFRDRSGSSEWAQCNQRVLRGARGKSESERERFEDYADVFEDGRATSKECRQRLEDRKDEEMGSPIQTPRRNAHF
jgi:hypothetical protein